MTLVDDHLRRYPLMQVDDVYKLLFQSVLGSEHLITSAENFAARLRAEYDAVPPKDVNPLFGGDGDSVLPAETEPLLEPIRPDGTLARVNLKPFKAQRGSVDQLSADCLRTANRPWGTREELQAIWATFIEQCRTGRWPHFNITEVEAFTALIVQHHYPAVHHSSQYEAAYHPAYRLIETKNAQW